MMYPQLHPIPDPPSTRAWRLAAGAATAAAAMGALVGTTTATFLTGLGWTWTEPILTPLVALVAAGSVYGQYRHLPLDPGQIRTARMLVLTGAGMMVAAVATGQPSMAGAALWFMTVATVVVTVLAAAHDSVDDSDGSLPWARIA